LFGLLQGEGDEWKACMMGKEGAWMEEELDLQSLATGALDLRAKDL